MLYGLKMRRNKSKILSYSLEVKKNVKKKSKRNFIDTEKICIYACNGGVGDILMLTAPLKALRKKYPNSYIELAVHTNGANDTLFNFLKPLNIVNKVSNYRTVRKDRFGTFVDVSVVAEPAWEVAGINLRSRIDYYSELLKVEVKEKIPFIGLSNNEKLKAKKLLAEYKKVFFIDTSSVDDRRCIPLKVIKELINEINKNEKNHLVLISDWRNKRNWSNFENVRDVTNLPLREISALIGESDYFFGPDSALMHISAATKTKSLVAFGMIPPEYRISTYFTHQATRVESLKCLGCWYKPCYNNLKCMKNLNAKEIYKSMRML